MINLLPSEIKENIYYGRKNSTIVRWIIANTAMILAILVVLFFGGVFIDHSRQNLTTSNELIETNIKAEKLDTVQEDAKELSDGVKLISQILSQELLFSKLLQELGGLMPEKTVLGSVSLTSNISTPLDITASAIDYNAATQVQLNFQDKTKGLFETVDANNITCTNDEKTAYKCTISIRAKFSASAAITYSSSAHVSSGVTQ